MNKSTDLQLTATINNYQISILRILCEGWFRIKGAWGTLLGSALLLTLLPIVFIEVPDVFAKGHPFYFLFQIYSVLFYIMMIPLQIGIWLLGVQWVAGEPIRIRMLLDYFQKSNIKKLFFLVLFYLVRVWIPILLFGALLLWIFDQTMLPFLKDWLKAPVLVWDFKTALMTIGFVVVLGMALLLMIYWLMSYMMSIPLVFYKKLSPWHAMSLAVRAFNRRWFKLLMLFSVQYIFSFLIGITVSVLCIWLYTLIIAEPVSSNWNAFFASTSMIIACSYLIVMILLRPWLLTVYGIVYREMFGNENSENSENSENKKEVV